MNETEAARPFSSGSAAVAGLAAGIVGVRVAAHVLCDLGDLLDHLGGIGRPRVDGRGRCIDGIDRLG